MRAIMGEFLVAALAFAYIFGPLAILATQGCAVLSARAEPKKVEKIEMGCACDDADGDDLAKLPNGLRDSVAKEKRPFPTPLTPAPDLDSCGPIVKKCRDMANDCVELADSAKFIIGENSKLRGELRSCLTDLKETRAK